MTDIKENTSGQGKSMDRQGMIDKIYEVISDKKLSRFCKINHYRDSYRGNEEENLIVVSVDIDNLICFNGTRYYQSDGRESIVEVSKDDLDNESYEIIGHPVMIGDILDKLNLIDYGLGYVRGTDLDDKACDKLLLLYKKMRQPIEKQSDECVEYTYKLLKEQRLI